MGMYVNPCSKRLYMYRVISAYGHSAIFPLLFHDYLTYWGEDRQKSYNELPSETSGQG